MKKQVRLFALLGMLSGIPASHGVAQIVQSDSQTLTAVLSNLQDSYQRKDIAVFMSCFSSSSYQGLDALKTEVLNDWEQFSYSLSVSTPPIIEVGVNVATATISSVMTISPRNAKPVDVLVVTRFGFIFEGKRWLIWRREFLSRTPLTQLN